MNATKQQSEIDLLAFDRRLDSVLFWQNVCELLKCAAVHAKKVVLAWEANGECSHTLQFNKKCQRLDVSIWTTAHWFFYQIEISIIKLAES